MPRTLYLPLAIGVFIALAIGVHPRGQTAASEVVLWPGVSATLHGNWLRTTDATAAGGARVSNPDAGLARPAAAAAPADYFDMTFNATAGVPYRLWIRGRAQGNSWANDSTYVQFSNSADASGNPAFRIGSVSASTVTLEDCTNCGVSGWGWQDNGFGAGVLGPRIYFSTSGQQTIRIQRREDGLSIDQVVLSPAQWLNTSPGNLKNDTTILPATDGGDPPPPTLPTGWQSQDIGSVDQPGSASESGGTFTVSGSGANIGGTADAFHFAYRTWSGDGTIVARVAAIQGGQAATEVGVMIRQTTAANSANAMMLLTKTNGAAFQRRTAAGALTPSTAAPGTVPRWVRLTRTGNTIAASISANGTAWTAVGQATFSMPQTVLYGLATSSRQAMALATTTFDNVTIAPPAASGPWNNGRLEVAPNRRFLRHQGTGKPFFYLSEAPWGIFTRVNREDADFYLRDTASKGFNVIQAAALWRMPTSRNFYGDRPMVLVTATGKYDPAQIVTTPGTDPNDAAAYDYWDHVDYVISKAEQYGMYVALLPTWGEYVSGTNSTAMDMSSNIFTVATARSYGRFLGQRYRNRPNIIWVMGGDRSAVYTNGDFRAVWRSMAEGVAEGVTGQTPAWDQPHAAWDQVLMTYHPRRADNPGSSIWFHNDPWLDFNGIEAEHFDLNTKVALDWNKTPAKPTGILEGRYEDERANDGTRGDAFRQRYQLYQAVFAGSLGYAYGHLCIWDFLNPASTGKTWRQALNDPGRQSMRLIKELFAGFTDAELLNRMPDQTMLDGSLGRSSTQNLLIAMRDTNNRYALVYSTNGRDIRLKAARLAGTTADAFWFSPRTGLLYNNAGTAVSGAFEQFPTGTGAPIKVFNPPGIAEAGNDWILKVRVR